ncbi:MAG TPA: hypothetical protein DD727_02535 [Clostridiales bacterium]|nr:hypothetical protein [Clostridiales bacterium]
MRKQKKDRSFRPGGRFTCLIAVVLVLLTVSPGCKKSPAATTAKAAQTTVKATAAQITAKPASAATTTKAATAAEVPAEQTLAEESSKETYVDKEFTADEEYIPEQILDLGGQNIILATWGTYDNIRKTYYDEEYMKTRPAAEYAVFKRMQAAMQKYNFKLDFNMTSDGVGFQKNFVSNILAGINFGDLCGAGADYVFPNYVTNKVIIPIDQYYDFSTDPFDWKDNEFMMASAKWQGHIWQINTNRHGTYIGTLFDKKILAREGMPDPIDMVNNRTWNWDNFLSMAVTMTKDTNGDALLDQWGILPGASLLQGLVYSNGGKYTYVHEDGKVTFGLTESRAMKALQFANELMNVYKVTGGTLFGSNYGFYVNVTGQMWQHVSRGFDFDMVPTPMGPDVNEYIAVAGGGWWVVPITTKIPKEVINIFMEVWSVWDNSRPFGLENKDIMIRQNMKTAYFYSDRALDIVVGGQRWDTEFSGGFTGLNALITANILTPITKGAISVGTAVDAINAQAQSVIDSAMYK